MIAKAQAGIQAISSPESLRALLHTIIAFRERQALRLEAARLKAGLDAASAAVVTAGRHEQALEAQIERHRRRWDRLSGSDRNPGADPRPAAEAAYHDPSFPPRACDRCGASYRGPAVYCSLACALADA